VESRCFRSARIDFSLPLHLCCCCCCCWVAKVNRALEDRRKQQEEKVEKEKKTTCRVENNYLFCRDNRIAQGMRCRIYGHCSKTSRPIREKEIDAEIVSLSRTPLKSRRTQLLCGRKWERTFLCRDDFTIFSFSFASFPPARLSQVKTAAPAWVESKIVDSYLLGAGNGLCPNKSAHVSHTGCMKCITKRSTGIIYIWRLYVLAFFTFARALIF
jgi:hypothetical protein